MIFGRFSNLSFVPCSFNLIAQFGFDFDEYFAKVTDADVERSATALNGSGRCAGVWGLEGITVHGDVYTDSYSSAEDTYGNGPVYQNGDLCSCQDVRIGGSAEIHGDALHGSGYSHIEPGCRQIAGLNSAAPADSQIKVIRLKIFPDLGISGS